MSIRTKTMENKTIKTETIDHRRGPSVLRSSGTRTIRTNTIRTQTTRSSANPPLESFSLAGMAIYNQCSPEIGMTRDRRPLPEEKEREKKLIKQFSLASSPSLPPPLAGLFYLAVAVFLASRLTRPNVFTVRKPTDFSELHTNWFLRLSNCGMFGQALREKAGERKRQQTVAPP